MRQNDADTKGIVSETIRRVWNIANLPAVIAAFVVLSAAIVAENVNYEIHLQDARAELQNRANLIGSKLQGEITANVELARGFASTIATQPNITQARFADLAEIIIREKPQLNNFAAAPDLVVSLVYPMKGNERVFGLDYRKNAAQRAAALRARDTSETTLAGPVNLVQGGQGFIARYPIFVADTHSLHGQRFWGILSAVVRTEEIYKASGILDHPDIDFALVGKDGRAAQGEQFFGPSTVLENDPVKVTIDFGVGTWFLYAMPEKGWVVSPDNVWLIRSVALAALLLVVVPFIFVGWLFRDRVAQLKVNIRRQKELARLTKRLELALQTSRIGVWEFDLVSREICWDERMKELYGFGRGELVTDTLWQSRLHPEDRRRILMETAQAIANKGLYKTEFRICLPDGTERTIRSVGSFLVDGKGETRLVGVNWDISEDVARERELQAAHEEIEHRYRELELAQTRMESMALHDFLTGLPNRRYFDGHVNGQYGREGCLCDQTYLMKIDLDGFKQINDRFGHAAGDAFLVQVAKLLRAVTEAGEFAARIGGDEFVVICKSGPSGDRPSELAGKIITGLQKSFDYKGRACRLGASIGIAGFKASGCDFDKLMSDSDLALYQSKKNGKGRFTFFSEPLGQCARKEKQLSEDLLRGIEHREFVAFFQGQYCAKTHELVGAEALARWQHPERGLLAPVDFVPLAEKIGVMGEIDAMVLDQAIAAKRNWHKAGLLLPRVSVNVSARRLGDRELIPTLKSLEFEPGSLTFELVESTFLDRSEAQVAANIRQIRDMGIEIEIDDFGTAYASIVSLIHLLPNRLKIDRQLIAPVIESADQRELVQSIIHIGRTLGIGSVAEGIESREQAEVLRIMGVDVVQGYAFCRPISERDFLMLHLSRGETRAVS